MRIVRRESSTAVTTPRRSSRISVTSAASMATSVPEPIATPTSAWARAGASLMPSPTIATTRPSACSRVTSRAFCSGSTSATTRSMPACARDRLRGLARVVAGEHHDLEPERAQRRDRAGGLGLERVGHRDQAGALPSTRDEHRRLARRRRARSRGVRRASTSTPALAISARFPSRTRPSTAPPRPARAPPGTRRPPAARARAPSRAATIAAASGCSEPRSAAAASAQERRPRRPPAARPRRSTSGRPSVRCRSCRARPCRSRGAARAPRRP